jgi:hypothetical protein
VIRPGQELDRLELLRFGACELVRFGLAGGWVGAGADGFVLRVEDGVEPVRDAGGPLAPACGFDVALHHAVQVDDGGIVSPWAAEEDVLLAGLGGEVAVVEDEGGLLVGEVLALRGKVAAGSVQGAMDLAAVEDRVAVTVDEIDVSGDDAVGKVAARGSRDAGRARGRDGCWLGGRRVGGRTGRRHAQAARLAAALCANVKGVLVGENLNVVQNSYLNAPGWNFGYAPPVSITDNIPPTRVFEIEYTYLPFDSKNIG